MVFNGLNLKKMNQSKTQVMDNEECVKDSRDRCCDVTASSGISEARS